MSAGIELSRRGWALFSLAATLLSTGAQGGQYFQDFTSFAVGATNFGDGAQLFSTHSSNVAGVVDNTFKELQLTALGIGDTASAFMLPDLDPGKPVHAFSAKWNAMVFGNFNNAADGFSFNFGSLSGLNLTNGAVESGYGVGLSVGVQTYSGNNPGFYLRVNGVTYVLQTNNPVAQWGVSNTMRHFFEVDWHYTNGLTVRVDQQTIFHNVPTYGFAPKAGDRFVWAARTGGLTETLRLDNLVVLTGGVLANLPTTSPYFNRAGDFTPEFAFDENDSTTWHTFAPTGIIGGTLSQTGVARAYALTSYNDTDRTADPRVWTYDGSTNGGVNWTTLGTGGGSFARLMETRAWPATNPALVNAIRLNITNNNGNGAVTRLGELRSYGFTAVTGPVWRLSLNNTNWFRSISCSADLSIMVAASDGDYLWVQGYYSPDTWHRTTNFNLPRTNWVAATVAKSNEYQWVAARGSGHVYVRPDAHISGPNWIEASALGSNNWRSVANSAMGNKVIAAVNVGRIFYSSNYGLNWVELTNALSTTWSDVCLSADGTKMAGVVPSLGVLYSTNSGASWTVGLNSNKSWRSIACSADGTKLVACAGVHPQGTIWLSTNSGASWTECAAPATDWRDVASSADGRRLAACNSLGTVYRSIDGGATWYQINTNFLSWFALDSSSDGNRVVVTTVDDGIWIYQGDEPDPRPTIVSQTRSGLTNALLSAQINPNRLNSVAWIEWGTNTSYGNTIAMQNIGQGSNAVTIQAVLNGLALGAYHFRAVATNGAGSAYGPDQMFSIVDPAAFLNIALPGDPVVPTSGNSPDAQQAPKAIDATASSKYLNFDEFNSGFTVFPSITDRVVHALGLISAEDAPERDPASYALYGSPDGTNFTVISSNALPLFPARSSIRTIAFPNTNGYPVYRIIFPTVVDSNAANSMQIAEVELLPYGEITSTNDAIALELGGGASLTAESSPGGLIDRQMSGVSNKVVIVDTAFLTTRVSLTPAAGPSIVKGIQIIGGYDDVEFPGRTPTSLMLEGTHNGTNFTSLLTKTLSAPTTNLQLYGYSMLGNTNVFESYRITLGWPQSGTVLQLGEVRLFGITFPTVSVERAGGSVLVTWPSHAGSFWLQQTTHLPAGNWSNVASPVAITNNRNETLVAPALNAESYRLFFP